MPPDRPSKVSREGKASILAYILSADNFPAGRTELPQQTEVLRDIRIDAAKPEKK